MCSEYFYANMPLTNCLIRTDAPFLKDSSNISFCFLMLSSLTSTPPILPTVVASGCFSTYSDRSRLTSVFVRL